MTVSAVLKNNISQIEDYSLNDVIEKILLDDLIPQNEINEAVNEFKKFLTLILLHPNKPMAMTSKAVDVVWHTFILFTKQYAEFCSKTFGYYVHHEPAASNYKIKEEAKINFFNAYKEHFGEIPAVWGNNTICHNVPPGDCGANECGDIVNVC